MTLKRSKDGSMPMTSPAPQLIPERVWILTGATGHLGNTVAKWLSLRGAKMRCLGLEAECPAQLKMLEGPDFLYLSGDIRDPEVLRQLFEGLEGREIIVVHMAGKISISDTVDPSVYDINIKGTDLMLEAAARAHAKRFLYVSSVHALAEPEQDVEIFEQNNYDPERVVGAYAKSKAIATQHVLSASISRQKQAAIKAENKVEAASLASTPSASSQASSPPPTDAPIPSKSAEPSKHSKTLSRLNKESKELERLAQYPAPQVSMETIVLMPSGIIGPGDFEIGHTTRLFIQFLKRRMRQAVHGGYDFTDVRDVAEAIVRAADLGRDGECYILANRFYEIADLLNTLATLTGIKKITHFVPMTLAKLFCPFAALYYKLKKQRPLYTKYSLYTLRSHSKFSHAKAERELGYRPRPLIETMRDTLHFLRRQKWSR